MFILVAIFLSFFYASKAFLKLSWRNPSKLSMLYFPEITSFCLSSVHSNFVYSPQNVQNSVWIASSSTTVTLSGNDLKVILDNPATRSKYYIIDVRNPAEQQLEYLSGNDIILIPLGIEDTWSEVVKKVETLDNRKPAIVVCATGFRSKIFSSFLSRSGFDKVYILDGGLDKYAAKNDPSIFH